MNIKDRIEKIFSRKTNPEEFFKGKKIRKNEQEVYSFVDGIQLKNLTDKDDVKNQLSQYLHSNVNITSVDYGFVLLPAHRVPGWADTTWPVGEEEVNNVWKIDVKKDSKKISLATIRGDLAVLKSDDSIKFNPYPKGYEFEDKKQTITTKYKVTGGAWNEAEVTNVVPRFRYDGKQIQLIGATEISGLSHHGNGGGSFTETARKLLRAEDFVKIRQEQEILRRQNSLANKNSK